MYLIIFTTVMIALTKQIEEKPILQTNPTSNSISYNSNNHRYKFQNLLVESIQAIQNIIEENKVLNDCSKFSPRELKQLDLIQKIHVHTYNTIIKKPLKFEKELNEHTQLAQGITTLAAKFLKKEKISLNSLDKLKDLCKQEEQLKDNFLNQQKNSENSRWQAKL